MASHDKHIVLANTLVSYSREALETRRGVVLVLTYVSKGVPPGIYVWEFL